MQALALESLPVTEKLAQEKPRDHINLAFDPAFLGRRDDAIREAERALEAMAADVPRSQHYLWNFATIYIVLGEPERAIEKLDEYLTVWSNRTAAGIEADPFWDPIRDHPRFQALLVQYAN